jgi:O-antigen/teichoic acid export membrane protein
MIKRNLQILAVLSNWLSRLISIGIQLVSIPMLTTKLGQEGFAAYALIISLLAWYGLTDMGMGKSLQNFIGECRAKKEDFASYIAVSAAFLFFLISIFILVLLTLSAEIGDFLLSRFEFISPDEAKTIILISGILLLGYMLGLVTTQALYALGYGVYANLLTIICNSTFLGFLFLIDQRGNFDTLFLCVLAYVAPLGAVGLISYAAFVIRYWKFKGINFKSTLSKLWKRAYKFSLYSFMSTLVLSTDYIIMSRTLNPNDIAIYNILYRIFWVGMSFYIGLLAAAWPLFTGWAALQQWDKFKKALRAHIAIGFIGVALMTLTLFYLLPYIIKFLAPKFELEIQMGTIAVFGAYIALRIWSDTFSTALQTMSNLSTLIKCLPLQVLISISAQYVLSLRFGVNGILYGLMASFVLTTAWILPLKVYRLTRSIKVDK